MNRVSLVAALATVAACFSPPAGTLGGGSGGGGGVVGASGGGGATGVGVPSGAAGNLGQPCAEIDETMRMIPPDILVLLDASGSMNDDASGETCDGGCGARSKWGLATAAINRVVADTEATVNWGLKWFPDSAGACGVTAGLAAPVATGNAARIADAIATRTTANGSLTTSGSTPTRLAVQAGTSYLAGLGGDGGRKVLLLITDGAPNCAPGSTDTQADDSAGAVQAIADSAALGVQTIVVGVATLGGPADPVLNDMALAGGLAQPAGPSSYYPAANIVELTDTLRGLAKTTADCVFDLPLPPNSDTVRSNIGVRAGGVNLPRDTTHTNGWDFTDAGAAIQIYGPPCDAYLAGDLPSVSIVFLCHDP